MNHLAKIEKKIIGAALLLMTIFISFLIYASQVLGIKLPGCNTDFKPFEKGQVIKRDDKTFEVQMVAKMWAFEPAEIFVPIGSTVQMYVSSKDVGHGFHIHGTNINLMAIPGSVNAAVFHPQAVGSHRITCHEYCGVGHQNMSAVIHVFDPETQPDIAMNAQKSWGNGENSTHQSSASEGSVSLNEIQARGKLVYETKTCNACHSIDGSAMVGPTFKGLFGKTEHFEDESQHVIDEKFIQNYIRKPNVPVVKGFAPAMPVLPLTDDEILEVTEYIKTLK